MSIDWFTVGAQALNLFVLLLLLKRFLYKPILTAIDEREKRISAELLSAETDKNAAKMKKEEYDKKYEDLNQQRASFLKNAQEEAQNEKQRLQKEAQEEAEKLSAKRQEALAIEDASLRHEVSRRLQEEAIALARKVLVDLAGANLEEQSVLAFTKRLQDLDPKQKQDLKLALKSESDTILLQTALDISPELRIHTEAAIKDIFGSQLQVRFESSHELIIGIELSVHGQKIAWSVADYLSSMVNDFKSLLKEQDP